jgi:hypothetical protein
MTIILTLERETEAQKVSDPSRVRNLGQWRVLRPLQTSTPSPQRPLHPLLLEVWDSSGARLHPQDQLFKMSPRSPRETEGQTSRGVPAAWWQIEDWE